MSAQMMHGIAQVLSEFSGCLLWTSAMLVIGTKSEPPGWAGRFLKVAVWLVALWLPLFIASYFMGAR